MKFERGNELFGILDRGIIPNIQLLQLREEGVVVSPPLSPRPQDWWVQSFDWYFVLDLVPNWEYGPFYYGGGDQFWPQIGIASDESSEKKCFFGLKKAETDKEFNDLYAPHATNSMQFIYEFKIELSKEIFFHDPLLFIGPVKDGKGFQVNPNRITAKLIQLEILAGNVFRYELLRGRRGAPRRYSNEPQRYIPFQHKEQERLLENLHANLARH